MTSQTEYFLLLSPSEAMVAVEHTQNLQNDNTVINSRNLHAATEHKF